MYITTIRSNQHLKQLGVELDLPSDRDVIFHPTMPCRGATMASYPLFKGVIWLINQMQNYKHTRTHDIINQRVHTTLLLCLVVHNIIYHVKHVFILSNKFSLWRYNVAYNKGKVIKLCNHHDTIWILMYVWQLIRVT